MYDPRDWDFASDTMAVTSSWPVTASQPVTAAPVTHSEHPLVELVDALLLVVAFVLLACVLLWRYGGDFSWIVGTTSSNDRRARSMAHECSVATTGRINLCNHVTTHGTFLVTLSRVFSQWDIVGAVCLERKPIIAQPLTPLEEKYLKYIQKLEVEKSLLSDHEKRHIEDIRIAKKFKEGALDDMDLVAKQTAQDFEDACADDLKKFQPAAKITDADINNDKHSLLRKLDCSLVLVINEKLGNEFKWVLPQTVHQDGETLRQTAERAFKEVATCSSKIQFMGNAPVGYYKYKYPKAIRGNGICGAKVFFFKAQLLDPKEDCVVVHKTETVNDSLWLTHSELEEVLVSGLSKSVKSFLYPDSVGSENYENFQSSDEEELQISSSVVNQG